MLPYTPVHHLLFHNPDISEGNGGYRQKQLEMLVMTSGNRSNEPIYFKDKDALDNLLDIADYFLANDREIFIRTDDSVTRVFREREYPVRRSRGYVPIPVTCGVIEKIESDNSRRIPSVLACGGELKNTFCLNRGEEFYMSHHIGDLENAETLESFESGIEHFKGILGIQPEIVACDLHPDYLSTKYALSMPDIKKVYVQHHHAHIASCMAENNIYEEVIGVAFDGTGYGEDGNIWGGEFFTGTYGSFKRAGHLEYVEMPGGELAIREPWRMALSWLYKAGIDLRNSQKVVKVKILPEAFGNDKLSILYNMIERGVNCPLTSSAGRLFDAVSALLGIRLKINYEGQAAVELENNAKSCESLPYPFYLEQSDGLFIVKCKEIFNEIVKDIDSGLEKCIIASRFHETAAEIIMEGCINIRKNTGIKEVVLSGGVFQNMTLLERTVYKLESEGFHVFTHSSVPANDGGIALGQAVTAIVYSLR
jgi:hydrogenase maturation protein HypF